MENPGGEGGANQKVLHGGYGSFLEPHINIVEGSSVTGPAVSALGLHAVAPAGSNLFLISGLDLFLVVLRSTLPGFVNSQLVSSC